MFYGRRLELRCNWWGKICKKLKVQIADILSIIQKVIGALKALFKTWWIAIAFLEMSYI